MIKIIYNNIVIYLDVLVYPFIKFFNQIKQYHHMTICFYTSFKEIENFFINIKSHWLHFIDKKAEYYYIFFLTSV